MQKWTTSLMTLLKDEDDVKCFICTRKLRPLPFKSLVNKILFFWMPVQYEVGFVRPLEEDTSMASVFMITVCYKCGIWAHDNPVAGEMLAKARMESINKHGEE